METKQKIIDTAIDLFQQDGIKSVTMDEIASHAGVSKRTIYEIFTNKAELLKACMDKITEENLSTLRQIRQNSNCFHETIKKLEEFHIQSLQRFHPNFYLDFQKFFPGLWKHINDRNETMKMSEILYFLKENIKNGLIRADVHITFVSRVILELFKLAFSIELDEATRIDRKNIYKDLIVNYFRGIATEKGLKELDTAEDQEIKFSNSTYN
ncbi:MAG: TetR/AcrR family transcriptional regulator [Lentimicrobium sp.]